MVGYIDLGRFKKVGDNGFKLIWEKPIDEHEMEARCFSHRPSGCQLLHLNSQDPNRIFMIFFLTPPNASNGLPHILEHMVLCGSEKYPLKEPFRELLKGSLNTFLNAFTYPDRTCYPVASKHEKDLLNLADVYLDAVFNPLLKKEAFYQEAWHIVPAEGTLNGVVFSEMKGAYSAPEHLLRDLSLRSLFRGHVYGFDSGGDPKQIPFLDYETLLSFHRRFYCPKNAKVILYGRGNIRAFLDLLEGYLMAKEGGTSYTIPEFEPKSSPVSLEEYYQASQEEKAYIAYGWGLGPASDIKLTLSMLVLEEALLGSAGAPLRKRLMDSGVGEDLVAEGLEAELKYLSFHVGMKGVSKERCSDFEKELFEALQDFIKDGIPTSHIEAALNRVEFRLREGLQGNLPKGLVLSLWAASRWAYGEDPLCLLSFSKPFNEIRRFFLEDPSYSKGLLDQLFVKNGWISKVLLLPSQDKTKEFLKWEKLRCEQELSSSQRFWEYEYNRYKTYMLSLDPEEEKAKIPRLRISELSKEPEEIPTIPSTEGGVILLAHPIPTSGIVYIDLGIPIRGINEEGFYLVPILGRCLLEMGTKDLTLSDLSATIGKVTGGFWPEIHSFSSMDARPYYFLFLRAKVLAEKLEGFFELIDRTLIDRRFEDNGRLEQILKEELARTEEGLIERGHAFALRRAKAHFGGPFMVSELSGGISYFEFLKKIHTAPETQVGSLCHRLSCLWQELFVRKGLLFNITSDGHMLEKALRGARRFLDHLNLKASDPSETNIEAPFFRDQEGFGISSQVYFVGSARNIPHEDFNGSWLCAIKYLRTAYLWEEVRMKGGAYGAYTNLDWTTGVVGLASYRDPNPENTIRCFSGAGAFLEGLSISPDELERVIIATVGELDRHMEAHEKGFVGMLRYLRGEDMEFLRRVREQVLSTTLKGIREFGQVLGGEGRWITTKLLGPSDGVKRVLEAFGYQAETKELL